MDTHPKAAVKIYKALNHVLVDRFRNTDIKFALVRAMGG